LSDPKPVRYVFVEEDCRNAQRHCVLSKGGNVAVVRVSRDDVAALLAVYLIQQNPLLPSAREQALGHLFQVVLYEAEVPLSYSDLADRAAEFVALRTRWPEEFAQPAIQRCVERGRLEYQEGKYSLTETARQGLEVARETYMSDENHFDSQLVAAVEDAVGRELDDLAVPFLTSEVKRALAEMLQHASIELAQREDGEPYASMLAASSGYEPLEFLEGSAETIANSFGLPSSQDLLAGIRRFLGDLDARSQRFIAGLHNKVFYRQVLNIDPELHRVQREALKCMRLYLDTNIAIDAMLDELDEHGATAEIVGASKRLDVQLFVSPVTLQELCRQIEVAEERVPLANDPRIEAMFVDSKFNRHVPPFLIAFLRRRRQQHGVTWGGFVAPYRDVEQWLLGNDILVAGEDFDSVSDEPAYQQVRVELRRIRQTASDSVIDHDTQNFVLIHKLRAKYEENVLVGPSVWLLTRDSSLAELERRMAAAFKIRHSFQRDDWGRVLMPYQSILDFTFSDYAAELVRSRLGIVPEEDSLDLEFLDSVRHPEFDLEEILQLPEEHAASVLVSLQKDRQAQLLAATLRESCDADERTRAGRGLAERALAVVVEEKAGAQREAARLEARLRRLEHQLRERGARLSDLEAKLRACDVEMAKLRGRSIWLKIRKFFRLGSQRERPPD
jgi:hypothetical protein